MSRLPLLYDRYSVEFVRMANLRAVEVRDKQLGAAETTVFNTKTRFLFVEDCNCSATAVPLGR